MTHTPGPWGMVVAGFDGWWVEGPSFIYPLADVIIIENEADARLIAAAPDLLAALEGAVDPFSTSSQKFWEWRRQADAAIAKATGREES